MNLWEKVADAKHAAADALGMVRNDVVHIGRSGPPDPVTGKRKETNTTITASVQAVSGVALLNTGDAETSDFLVESFSQDPEIAAGDLFDLGGGSIVRVLRVTGELVAGNPSRRYGYTCHCASAAR